MGITIFTKPGVRFVTRAKKIYNYYVCGLDWSFYHFLYLRVYFHTFTLRFHSKSNLTFF